MTGPITPRNLASAAAFFCPHQPPLAAFAQARSICRRRAGIKKRSTLSTERSSQLLKALALLHVRTRTTRPRTEERRNNGKAAIAATSVIRSGASERARRGDANDEAREEHTSKHGGGESQPPPLVLSHLPSIRSVSQAGSLCLPCIEYLLTEHTGELKIPQHVVTNLPKLWQYT